MCCPCLMSFRSLHHPAVHAALAGAARCSVLWKHSRVPTRAPGFESSVRLGKAPATSRWFERACACADKLPPLAPARLAVHHQRTKPAPDADTLHLQPHTLPSPGLGRFRALRFGAPPSSAPCGVTPTYPIRARELPPGRERCGGPRTSAGIEAAWWLPTGVMDWRAVDRTPARVVTRRLPLSI